ncbi:hypothetical protein [Imhoffiella purpurea]|uniref:Uncharacterized protein n=1 Tax=Imhoffiella purpurea TaxID=1249627 RepID=W9V898_9GAMM|nr:hypothetical protein [Imhoffiella purpurea]EXJ15654.1 hypothetical protein D779_1161 [Imhoffiella purpurea]
MNQRQDRDEPGRPGSAPGDGVGERLEKSRADARRYFGEDGITPEAIGRFLADSGSAPLPDVGRLLKIAQEIPGDEDMGRRWAQLLQKEDLSTLIENPRACTEKYGIEPEGIKTRLETLRCRLDEEGALRFPDPSALANLVLTMAQHLGGYSETTGMSDLEETIRQNEDIIQRNMDLLNRTDTLMQEHERLLESHGLTAEAVGRFIESQHVSPEDRERIRVETARVEQEIAARESQLQPEPSPDATTGQVKRPRMRPMV